MLITGINGTYVKLTILLAGAGMANREKSLVITENVRIEQRNLVLNLKSRKGAKEESGSAMCCTHVACKFRYRSGSDDNIPTKVDEFQFTHRLPTELKATRFILFLTVTV